MPSGGSMLPPLARRAVGRGVAAAQPTKLHSRGNTGDAVVGMVGCPLRAAIEPLPLRLLNCPSHLTMPPAAALTYTCSMDKRRKKERRRRREQKVKSRVRAAQLAQVRSRRPPEQWEKHAPMQHAIQSLGDSTPCC